MPLQNGTAGTDSSSETSPAVLDEDAEVKSCTIYNSNITNGRAGELLARGHVLQQTLSASLVIFSLVRKHQIDRSHMVGGPLSHMASVFIS